MSKSIKKFPFYKDTKSSKWGKKYCNKQVRRAKDVPDGRSFKKFASRWDYIYDYCSSESWNEYQKRYKEDAIYYEWYRTYIGK